VDFDAPLRVFFSFFYGGSAAAQPSLWTGTRSLLERHAWCRAVKGPQKVRDGRPIAPTSAFMRACAWLVLPQLFIAWRFPARAGQRARGKAPPRNLWKARSFSAACTLPMRSGFDRIANLEDPPVAEMD